MHNNARFLKWYLSIFLLLLLIAITPALLLFLWRIGWRPWHEAPATERNTELNKVIRQRLDELTAWHRQRHQRVISYDDEVVEFLLTLGSSPLYGGRPIRRTIDRLVTFAVLDARRQGGSGSGRLVIDGGQLCLNPQ